MELQHTDRIFFDETSHSYVLDGDELLMGVTELMRKHNLGADYSGIPDSVLKRAAEVGTGLHKEIQDYENGESVFASELIDEYKKLGLKFIESEYQVSDFSLVASAIDMVYEGSARDKAILVDIKSTEKLHRRSLEWQLGIYRTLFEAQNPGIEVEALFCLHIDKKTRRIKGFIPIDGVSADEVKSLLSTEAEGLIYIDENAVHDASLALNENDIRSYVSSAVEIAALKERIKEIEKGLKGYDERLLAYMSDNNIDELAAPGGVFKRKAPYQQTRVDSAKLKKTYPTVFEKCSKVIEVAASITFKPTE